MTLALSENPQYEILKRHVSAGEAMSYRLIGTDGGIEIGFNGRVSDMLGLKGRLMAACAEILCENAGGSVSLDECRKNVWENAVSGRAKYLVGTVLPYAAGAAFSLLGGCTVRENWGDFGSGEFRTGVLALAVGIGTLGIKYAVSRPLMEQEDDRRD